MPAFKLNIFSGLRPRLPDSLLPENSATIARNCDFAYGELRSTKAGFQLTTLSNAAKSIYTDDGVSFYSWTTDVNAVRSPLANDTFNRMYYTGDGGFKVANRNGTRPTGGVPESSYLVGVPRPTVAPTLAEQAPVAVTALSATLVLKLHYEYGGVKYQEQSATLTSSTDTQFKFTPPAKATDTPAQAFPVLRISAKWKTDNSQIFDLFTSNSSLDSTGGIYSLEISKDASGTGYTATLSTSVKESDKETRAYVYTYVNTYNEEGPPSPATQVTTGIGLGVNVSVTKDTQTGYAPLKEIRVYRTPSGSTVADYFYVGLIAVLSAPGTAFSFGDTTKAEQLNEPISSVNAYPPSQALTGLTTLPNGILWAWEGTELHFSEAYKPWSWPPAYVKPLPHAIVGGIAHGSGAIITTTSQPYAVDGVSPDSMTTRRINVEQAGVSKWSIAVVDGAVVYASNDGLVIMNGGTASLAQSQKFFTREVWRARYSAGLSSMRFCAWDGRLVVFSASASFTPFMIRVDEADGTLTELPDLVASCSFVSQLSDQFYYALGTGLYQFQGGAEQVTTWQSREAFSPVPVNYGFAQSVSTGTWVIDFYAEGILRHTKSLTAGVNNFRLPSGFKSDRWKIKLTGTGRFRELRVATSARELSTV